MCVQEVFESEKPKSYSTVTLAIVFIWGKTSGFNYMPNFIELVSR